MCGTMRHYHKSIRRKLLIKTNYFFSLEYRGILNN
jgi:hypothetical protein